MRKMMKAEMELDRISNIPDNVTEKILSLMSLREAVRTSVLSSNWRYKWEMLQSLVFDGKCISVQSHLRNFANIVDHVLLLHTGPIYKFKLSYIRENMSDTTRDMDRWILHLSKNPVIQTMILEIRNGNLYNVPSCLFSCQDVCLRLFRCLLNPSPFTCKGFRSLKSLLLNKVTIAQDVFDKLFCCSPLLELVKLLDCHGVTKFKIDAPKLRLLIYIAGGFQDFNLMGSPNVVDAAFGLHVNVDQGSGSSGNLIKFLRQLPHIQRFSISKNFLKYLSIGVLPAKLPEPCPYLKFLSLRISFHDPDEILTVLCLLRSSPVLQELHITVDPGNHQAAVREVKSCLYDDYNCTHTNLRLVKITKISSAKPQLDFIKFLLLSSPVLERMTVQPSSANGFSKQVKELLLFKRNWTSAEIMLLDP